MTQIILSTGNIVSGGPSIIRKPGTYRSNLELTNSLRSSFLAAQQEYGGGDLDNGVSNGHPAGTSNGHTAAAPSGPAWTARHLAGEEDNNRSGEGDGDGSRDTLYVPRLDFSGAGLQEDRSQYEITVKMFFLQPLAAAAADVVAGERARHVRRALGLVARELGGGGSGAGGAPLDIDLLIASFPGISFEGDCEWEADKRNAAMGCDEDEAATWAVLESLVAQQEEEEGKGAAGKESNGDGGAAPTATTNGTSSSSSSSSVRPPPPARIRRLGIAEFGSDKLARFLRQVRVRPSVDQINTRNCCSVPPPLAELAAAEGVELYSHSDCTDILPSGTLRELLGGGPQGAGVLAGPGEGEGEVAGGLEGDLVPQWVVKYTAFVKDRGVIENKGYFAGADLREVASS